MSIYKIKRFSSNQLDFSEVISFLKEYKDIPFEVLYRNNVYGTGLFINEFKIKDTDRLKEVLELLHTRFNYQFCFGEINGTLLKFKYQIFLDSVKIGDKIHAFLQPTTKIKADKFTQYIPKNTLVHFTDVSNLDSIIRNGLTPQGRSNGEKGYNYPPCIHFLTDLFGLFKYENGKIVPGGGGWRTNNLIMFEVTPPKRNTFILDPACDFGVICYNPIPKSCIRLVDPSEYGELFVTRSFPQSELNKRAKPILVSKIIL